MNCSGRIICYLNLIIWKMSGISTLWRNLTWNICVTIICSSDMISNGSGNAKAAMVSVIMSDTFLFLPNETQRKHKMYYIDNTRYTTLFCTIDHESALYRVLNQFSVNRSNLLSRCWSSLEQFSHNFSATKNHLIILREIAFSRKIEVNLEGMNNRGSLSSCGHIMRFSVALMFTARYPCVLRSIRGSRAASSIN